MSLVSELKRRNVFRVGIAYVVLGWLLLQVTDVVVPILDLPGWAARLVLFLLVIGLPLVLFFAWAYELTPEGIKRESDVERGRSITSRTGRKLDRAIIVVLAVALAWFAWDRFGPGSDEATLQPAGQAVALPVIAVLPFQATGSEDGGFLAAGLHDDLLTKLAKLGAFQVISRTSMMEYADRTRNMREIGEELGAGYILEGGVQARGGRVRVNAQLIHAADDEHVWAETYDRELTAVDLFDIQAELAVAIADAMQTTLSPADQSVVDMVPTDNLEAYNAYLRGLSTFQQSGWVGTQADRDAVTAFGEAVRLDPDFALAWAGLAMAWSRVTGNSFDQAASEKALDALARARELQPGLLEAELAWAEYQYRMQLEFAQALETLEALGDRIAGNAYALSLKAYLSRRVGRYEEGYQLLLAVARLEPRSAKTYVDLVSFAVHTDRCEAARNYSRTMLGLDPGSTTARARAAQVEIECDGDAARAARLLQGVDLVEIGDIPMLLVIALQARDKTLYLRVVNADRPNMPPYVDVYRQLNLVDFYTWLEPNPVEARAALARAGELIDEFEKDETIARSADFAGLKESYAAESGRADEVRHWVEEHRRRYRVEQKGDLLDEPMNHYSYAWDFVLVGLYDEAVEELRLMLERPGGRRFPFVDGTPVFDVLKDRPDYVALRERFGV